MEYALSKARIGGGGFILIKDLKLSSAESSVPSKLSVSGACVARLFQPSSWSGATKVWKDICVAEHNFLNKGTSRAARLQMWAAFDDIQSYFKALTLSVNERRAFRGKVENFRRLYVRCFGEGHVTHYVHVLVKHCIWFIENYGSLAVWSCQGMEKMHYAAKSAFQRHTQHGGGTGRVSPIVQTYEWWYKGIQH
jgi:hypothetical protein